MNKKRLFDSLVEPILFRMKIKSMVWLHYMLRTLHYNIQILINVEALAGHGVSQ
jgi:hypothetical protein